MKIQYCSDLHLEFADNKSFLEDCPTLPVGDVLLLAGDIVPLHLVNKRSDFLDYVSANFRTTYWVPGNHEYYGNNLKKRKGSFCHEIRNNVFLINNHVLKLDGVNLILSTQWSHLSPANESSIKQMMSDFLRNKIWQRDFNAWPI